MSSLPFIRPFLRPVNIFRAPLRGSHLLSQTFSRPRYFSVIPAAVLAAVVGTSLGYREWKEAVRLRAPCLNLHAATDQEATEEPGGGGITCPERAEYLIVGGGTAAMSAVRTLRGSQHNSKVLIVTEEDFAPYMRPPLSKQLWFEGANSDRLTFAGWDGSPQTIFFKTDDYFLPPADFSKLAENEGGVGIIKGRRVVSLDSFEQKATLDDGSTIVYGKCLLATGGKPKQLPIFSDPKFKGKVSVFRNAKDYQNLDKVFKQSTCKRVVIVGGGFLGSELAVALATKGKDSKEVIQIFPEAGNMGKVFPKFLSDWTMGKISALGVTVVPNVNLHSANLTENGCVQLCATDVHGNGETRVEADHVIVAVGIDADTDLAESAGLEVDPKQGGYLVNAELEARSNIYVAGDACCFYDIKLGRRRVEHHDHAVVSGRLAAENLVGRRKPYWHQSIFWSDLGPEIGYEAIGIIDSSLEVKAYFTYASPSDTPRDARASNVRDEAESSDDKEPRVHVVRSTSRQTAEEGDEFGKGLLFYLSPAGKVVGVITWNIFGKMPICRKVIGEGLVESELDSILRLFDLYEKK